MLKVSSVTTSYDQTQVGSDYVPPFEGTSSTVKVSESEGQNIPVYDKSLDIGDNSCQSVVTRAQARRIIHLLNVPSVNSLSVASKEFLYLQLNCSTIK